MKALTTILLSAILLTGCASKIGLHYDLALDYDAALVLDGAA